MRLGGLQKLTLLDFPGNVACTVFTVGCNFRCPFCHNSSLVLPGELHEEGVVSVEEFYQFLDKRKGRLDGVAITGGEPLLQPDIEEFIRTIKEKGFKVKLDTNGSYPEKLKKIVDEKLVDYIAMDIKSSLDEYGRAVGLTNAPVDQIKESIELLKNGDVEYEFRTTVVKELHSVGVFEKIGELIEGTKKYYLQRFEDSGELIDSVNYHAASEEELMNYLNVVRKWVPEAAIRGGEIG